MKKLDILILLVFIILFVLIAVFNKRLKDESLNLTTPFARDTIKSIQPTAIEPRLSINEIFGGNHQWVNSLPEDKKITLIATGDIIPARSVNYQTVSRNNFKWPFEKTADFLKAGDITLINLESPLTKNCPLTNGGMIFCGDGRNIQGLIFAGVDVANLSNNHLGNYGEEGIENTVGLLNNNGILVTGVSGATFKTVKNIKFAFLGYGMIGGGEMLSWATEEKVKKEIEAARKNADIVVVSFHWGDEYTPQPNEKQKMFAHLAIDSGADLIIGNHPHWIQPVELYRGKFITYAHGNFIFDQMWSEKTEEGVVGRYVFYDKKLVDVEFFPVFIKDYGQPYFFEGQPKNKIIEEMKRESLKLSL